MLRLPLLPLPLLLPLRLALGAPQRLVVDDTDARIEYSGLWTTQFSGAANFQNTLHTTFDVFGKAVFGPFNGTAISYVGSTNAVSPPPLSPLHPTQLPTQYTQLKRIQGPRQSLVHARAAGIRHPTGDPVRQPWCGV
ncbi:hypothetical protein BT69DRAFT_510818 [Atractiella rhizophila]|nr:hypothetical protein BT69DRAFT_510818 [Atractiella rhizophila]